MKNSFQPSAELIKLASSYFARHGIDPRVEPAPGSFPLAVPPVPAFSSHTAAAITTNPGGENEKRKIPGDASKRAVTCREG
jgi:hypothetical protein